VFAINTQNSHKLLLLINSSVFLKLFAERMSITAERRVYKDGDHELEGLLAYPKELVYSSKFL
jgi:hypothetical protein